MIERFDIAGYARISVDDEQDQKNISIENQKAIIEDYVKTHFPGSTLTFFEDRDRSGYTFEQREGYQEMRRGLMSHKYDILIIKDFSRFSRRNSRGLVELEDLRDAGVRIVSIGDGVDFPNDDDWLKIQFQFLVNEMPVTDTSRKVRSVVKRRQNDGEWICAAPYGYLVTEDKQFEIIPTEAETVRRIFDLYSNAGWGYKKIANYLTDQGVPTPRMSERMRKEAAGKKTKREAKNAWAIATVQGILDNDFYIGTLRQGKYTRAKINGRDIKRNDDEHIVIENHHQAIIDYRTFAITRALREKRSRSNYRGVKINDNATLSEQIGRRRPNDKVKLSVKRDGKVKQIDVTLRNKAGKTELITKEDVDMVEVLGGKFADAGAKLCRELDIKGGVQVVGIKADGILARARVKQGFVITHINDRPVYSLSDMERMTDKVRSIDGIYPNGRAASYVLVE